MMIKFVVPGRPVAAVRTTGKQKFVDPRYQRYHAYKEEFAWHAKLAKMRLDLMDLIAEPVEVIAVAYLRGKRRIDADNLAKSFLDSMNGVVWVDDQQVVKLTVEKRTVYKIEEQRVEIEIRIADQEETA